MKNLNIFLSEETANVIEDSIEQMREWKLPAVNSLVLLYSLLQEECSGLEEFFLDEGILKQDVENVLLANYELLKFHISAEKEAQNKKKENEEQKSKEKESVEEKNETTKIFFNDSEGQEVEMTCSMEVDKIFTEVLETCKREETECIEPIHVLNAMFVVKDETCRELFMDNDVDYYQAAKYFMDRSKYFNTIITYELSGFLTNLNENVDPDRPSEILGRDDEVEQVWNIALKRNKRNTVLVGEAGVGKTAIVEKITYDIVTENCPDRFIGFNVINLDVNSLIAGTTYRGQAEERIKKLIDFLKKRDDVILFIDEVHTILGAGSCFEGEMDLSNALKPILSRGDAIVIGATTMEEYEKYFKVDAAITRRFEKVEVEEPLNHEVYDMVKNKIAALEEFHDVKISKNVVQFCIMMASIFSFDQSNPDKTLDLIDKSMALASRNGKKRVTRECVLENFAYNMELFEKTSSEIREATAYHEVGHYVVGRLSKYAEACNFIAISILPMEGAAGLTVPEEKDEECIITDIDYIIDAIAFFLGGRAAEKIFLEHLNAGAMKDLEQATSLAIETVSKYGLGEDLSEFMMFVNTDEYPMFSEDIKNKLNSETKKLLKKGYKRACKILEDNVELVEELVQELMQNKILGQYELEKIAQKYLK